MFIENLNTDPLSFKGVVRETGKSEDIRLIKGEKTEDLMMDTAVVDSLLERYFKEEVKITITTEECENVLIDKIRNNYKRCNMIEIVEPETEKVEE